MPIKRRFVNTSTVFLITLALIFIVPVQISAQDTWTWTQRYDGPKHLNAVAAGNGTFIAVGNDGVILSSPDGIEWTERSSGTENGLYSVIWGDGMFVAGGDSGTIVTSMDGEVWTIRHSGEYGPIRSIVWGDGKYLAMADRLRGSNNLSFFTTNDGIVWIEQQQDTYFVDLHVNNLLVYGDGLFMTGYDDCFLPTSTDGITWETDPNKAQGPELAYATCSWCWRPNDPVCMPICRDVHSIAYGNGIFLLLGAGLARYEKGMDWKILELYTKCYWGGGTPERGHTIIHDGTRFVMAGKDGIYFTDNGEEFEQISTTSLNSGTSMVYNGEVYVTVHGTEIGTLSKEAVFVTNPKQPAKSASALSIRHSGNTLHLNLPDRGKAAIYSLNGSKVRSFDLSAGTHTLRLSSLPRGMYIVRANSGAWNRSARVLIK